MSETTGLGTNVICQIAIVVRDIEKTAAAYADVFGLPAPPAWRLTGPEEETHIRYRGAPTQARAKLAFIQMGPQLNLELIEPVGRPSTWGEFLDAHGEGVHHIAFRLQGMDGVLAYLEGKGIGVAQTGQFKNGHYAYLDSHPKLKVVLELLENFQ